MQDTCYIIHVLNSCTAFMCQDSLSMKIHHNTEKLMDNLRIDEIQVYGAPDDIHVVYLDYFTQFYDYDYDNVSIMNIQCST